MQTVTFDSVSSDELDTNFMKVLKTLFQGRKLRITVEPEMSETEYLNSSIPNKEILEKRIANIELRNYIKFDSMEELRESLNKKD